LGENPFVRMMKIEFDKECKICSKPFTVFRWRPGKDSRYKKTEICQICAKLKNICQTCLLDLEFGLPIQVRETLLGVSDDVSTSSSEVNREYQANMFENQLEKDFRVNQGRIEMREALIKLARTESGPYTRNQAHVCSFFLKGECKRGDECPYRHELPSSEESNESGKQNYQDRFIGKNDPVAKKILNRLNVSKLTPPYDKTITGLYVGNIRDTIKEEDLREAFSVFGELKQIQFILQSMGAVVTFAKRENAEKAAEVLYNNLNVKGVPLRLSWEKPHLNVPKETTTNTNSSTPQQSTNNFFSLPPVSSLDPKNFLITTPSTTRQFYPSMNPERIGGKRDR